MKTAWLVKVTAYAPYPIISNHTIKATAPGTALARAIKEALNLKWDGKPFIRKRRVESYSLTIKKL